MRKLYLAPALGAALVFLSTWTYTGSIGVTSPLPFSGSSPIAAAFMLAGAALMFALAPGRLRRAAQIPMGLALLALGVLAHASPQVLSDRLGRLPLKVPRWSYWG